MQQKTPNGHKKYFLQVACLLFFFVLYPLARANEATPKALPIATASFPPFKYIDPATGDVTGFDTEIIRAVFNEMGITPQITMMPFQRADILTRRGDYAAYYTFTRNPDREKDYFFSAPISSVQDVIFKKNTLQITWENYDDLADYLLGYSKRYNYDPYFLKAIKNKLPVIDNENERQLLNLLANNRVQIVICEKSVCSHLIDRYPKSFSTIDFVDKPVGIPEPRPFYVGFSKKWLNAEQLRDAFNSALEKWKNKKGKDISTIFAKYGVQCPKTIYPECSRQ